MSSLIKPGRLMFALGIIALGVLQFFAKDFIIGRPPAAEWAADIPGKLSWAYASGAMLILAGLGILLNIKATVSSLLIGIMILVFSFLLRHLPAAMKSTWEGILWSINLYKTLALFGGTLIIAASFFAEQGRNGIGPFTNKALILTGAVLFAVFFIISGFAHFKFDDFIKNYFIPAYIPFRPFWTYFAGVALIAAGLGLLIQPTRKPAAFLSGLMILLWFFLVHVPRAIKTPHENGEWMGVFESFAFSGILFVLAGLLSKGNRKII